MNTIRTKLHYRADILFRWYSVRLEEIILEGNTGNSGMSIGADVKRANAGKGVIVDSGTTDTYLPYYLRGRFEQLFRQVSGVAYSTSRMQISETQRAALPTVIFRLLSETGVVDVRVPSSSYIDKLGPGAFVGRIFLTENSGAVLGANVMNGHDVLFDPEGKRLGFALSDCVFAPPVPPPVTVSDPKKDSSESKVATSASSPPVATPATAGLRPLIIHYDWEMLPLHPCSARCNLKLGREYRVNGTQGWVNPGMFGSWRGSGNRTCTIGCSANDVPLPASDPSCTSSAWSECSHSCEQTRTLAIRDGTIECSRRIEKRPCQVGACTPNRGDTVLSFSIRFGGIGNDLWSYVWRERLQAAVARSLVVPVANVLVATNGARGSGPSTHMQIVVRVRFSSDVEKPGDPTLGGSHAFKMVRQYSFTNSIVQILNSEPDVSFFGWVRPQHMRISNIQLDLIDFETSGSGLLKGPVLKLVRLRDNISDGKVTDLAVLGSIVVAIILVNSFFCALRRRKHAAGTKERLKN